MVDQAFGNAELAAIEAAVRAAERDSGGEIRVVILGASADYPEVAWEGAALGALLASGLAAVGLLLSGAWGAAIWWVAAPTGFGAALGYLATRRSAVLTRLLAGGELLARQTALRAHVVFVEEEVFATRDRSGVLLFLSLFEHRVVVLGDSGIAARVAENEWEPIVDAAVEGLHRGRPAEAVVAAIAECGRLLAHHGVERRADDRNELADRARIAPR